MSGKRLQKHGGVDFAFSRLQRSGQEGRDSGSIKAHSGKTPHPLQSHRCGLASAQPRSWASNVPQPPMRLSSVLLTCHPGFGFFFFFLFFFFSFIYLFFFNFILFLNFT